MKKAVFLVLTLVVFGGVRPVVGDSNTRSKPIIVMSFSGYQAMMEDVKYGGELVGQNDLDKGIEGMLKLFTRGQGLAGIDQGRPWGMAIFDGGDMPVGYGFIPVTDLHKTLSLMEKMGPKFKETGHGIIEVDTQQRGRRIYIRESNGWAFISDKQANLDDLPSDPARLVAGLTDKYDWAIRLNVCNVPANQREKMIAQIKKNAHRHLDRIPVAGKEAAIQRMISGRVIELIDHASEQIEQVTAGWALDAPGKKAYFELSVTALPGTEFARQFDGQKGLTSNFAGFVLPDATVKCGFTAQCTAVDPEAVATLFSEIREVAYERIDKEIDSGEKAKRAKKFVNEVLRIVGETTASGHADGVMSARITPDELTMVCGRYVASGERLEPILRMAVDHARQEYPDMVKKYFKANADKFQGVSMHTISIPVPKECPVQKKAIQLVGKNFDIVIGFGKDAVYFAAGKDAVATLKRAIKDSQTQKNKKVPPLHFSVALHELTLYAAEICKERDREMIRKAATILAESKGKDHLNVTATSIQRGMQYRMEIEEGVLRLMMKSREMWRRSSR